ncbi:MAG: hypothetical protein LBO69_05585 [Ignavibacteria bacterium]|jgi:hypothetical protein|nr:hypothetical protein [Ignavibacteria bacterium]
MSEQEFQQHLNKLTVLADLSGERVESITAGNAMNATELEKAIVCIALYNYSHQIEMSSDDLLSEALDCISSTASRPSGTITTTPILGSIFNEDINGKVRKYVIVWVEPTYKSTSGITSGGRTFRGILIQDEHGKSVVPSGYEFSVDELTYNTSTFKGSFITSFHSVDVGDARSIVLPEGIIVGDKIDIDVKFNGYKGQNCFNLESGTNSDIASIPTDDCPAGSVRDSSGNCVANVINAGNACCSNPTVIPTDPMQMLPISVFFNDISKNSIINKLVLSDIMSKKGDRWVDENYHGAAMGMLHPSLDSGQPTGFGFFRGEKVQGYEQATGKPKYNIFCIGYAWKVNFASVIANGLCGNVDTGTDKSPSQWAYEIIKQNEDEDQNELSNFLYQQERDGVIELCEIRSEQGNHDAAFNDFAVASIDKNGYAQLGNGGHWVWVPIDAGGGNKRQSRLNMRVQQYAAQQTAMHFGIPTGVRNFKNNTAGKTWLGVGWNLSGILELLDQEDNIGRILVIMLDKATIPSKTNWIQTFMSVIEIACSVATSVVGLPGVGGSVVGKLMRDAVSYTSAGINLISPVKNIVEGKANLTTAINALTTLYQMGLLISPPETKTVLLPNNSGVLTPQEIYDDTTGCFGLNTILNGKWADSFKKLEQDFEKTFKDIDRASGGIITYIKEHKLGAPLAQMMGLGKVYHGLTTQPVLDYLTQIAGFEQNEVKQYYNNLKNGMNRAYSEATTIKPPYYKTGIKADSLNTAIALWENFRTASIGDVLQEFYTTKVSKNIQDWMLGMGVSGGNFLQSPMLREVMLKTASGAMLGSMPKIENIIGSAFKMNSNSAYGSGLDWTLDNLGADALFGMVKSATGFPTRKDELIEILKQSFLIDAGIDPLVGPTSEDDRVILPEYIDKEIQECIACSFIKSGIKTQRCEQGQIYNWVTGKCIRPMFNGYSPSNCYNACEHQKQFTGTLPTGLIQGDDGRFYYDIDNCNAINTALVALDTLVEGVSKVSGGLINE